MKQALSAFGDGGAFSQIFFEEAQEHLSATEASLLRLDPDAPSPDELNAIFRAVHSIKGSAGMLGFDEISTLAHVFENLLDLLRKGERPVARADVDAMLRAGDVVKAQVAHRRGDLDAPPDGHPAEASLRERVAAGGPAGTAPAQRTFRVRMGPLAAALDAAELEMMLTGLAEMGTLANQSVENAAGGFVAFDVTLEGAEADLRSVLALVVAPELTSVQLQPGASAPSTSAPAAAGCVNGDAASALPALGPGNELFIDPEQFRRERQARAAATSATGSGKRVTAPTPAHAADDQKPAGAGQHAGGSIRVATHKIDLLVNLVGELVITESVLSRQAMISGGEAGLGTPAGLADLARNTRDLQEAVLAIRMVPISDVFSRFPRLVRELSSVLGKQVQLTTSGESTELDRGLIEKISDPLTHLVRNAVDHGLETPEARVAAGKNPVGTVSLAAMQRGGKVVIEVRDDGRGLDRERILARAAERGRLVAPDAPDNEVWQVLFEAGFSTAQQVTELSGRGVGMDVVRRNILSLGGTVDVVSRPGRGVTITMTVPLTLAIMEAMTVSLGSQIYVLPLASVLESRSVDPSELHSLPGQGETLDVRGAYLPVLRLGNLFPSSQERADGDGIAVIVEADGGCAALLVDALVGQQQVVVKSLETNFRKVPGATGATIMSDGSVALILDVSHIVQLCRSARAALAVN
ncbi:MAG TPA: chemotaxis protein CheA [Ramlibacter sp.]|nr:chemotaxis protein CheA [Ramlibacter sp.]